MSDEDPFPEIENHPLARPIYQEPTEEMNEDWTWGVLVGGVQTVTHDLGIAQQYQKAADRLLEQAIRDGDLYEVGMPVAFLYRQAIESALKALVGPTGSNGRLTHDLIELVEKFEKLIGCPMEKQLRTRISELNELDARADAFRFTETTKGALHFPNEKWVDLKHLAKVVGVMLTGLAYWCEQKKMLYASPGST